jgi:nickel/cobalt exporter
MEFDNLFWAAFQSSLLLGLVHGVNPCGHSWLVLAPFVMGQKRGRKAAFLTFAFLSGTAVACLALGLTLGAVSAIIPETFEHWVDVGTAGLLVLLGAVLIINPHLLHHHHDEEHGHDHKHDLEHLNPTSKRQKMAGAALFGVGFANMIVPCPTVAIMYGYALDSGSALKATTVFGIYALATAAAVAAVIYAIFHVARLLKTLTQDWVETALMRGAGVVTILFAGYSLMMHIQ